MELPQADGALDVDFATFAADPFRRRRCRRRRRQRQRLLRSLLQSCFASLDDALGLTMRKRRFFLSDQTCVNTNASVVGQSINALNDTFIRKPP